MRRCVFEHGLDEGKGHSPSLSLSICCVVFASGILTQIRCFRHVELKYWKVPNLFFGCTESELWILVVNKHPQNELFFKTHLRSFKPY